MTFEEYVTEVFSNHHDSGGMDTEEIQDLIEESTHEQRVKWLKSIGYDLRKDYHNSI